GTKQAYPGRQTLFPSSCQRGLATNLKPLADDHRKKKLPRFKLGSEINHFWQEGLPNSSFPCIFSLFVRRRTAKIFDNTRRTRDKKSWDLGWVGYEVIIPQGSEGTFPVFPAFARGDCVRRLPSRRRRASASLPR